MADPALEAKEKPFYEVGGKKNPASPNSPTLYSSPSSKSLECYQSRNTHCGSINNINGFANNNKKRGSSVSIRISQEMLENDDEDKRKDFSWSPDPGGTPLPICRVAVASLAELPSHRHISFSSFSQETLPPLDRARLSTEKNDPTKQPALHAICLIKYLTRVPLPPYSDQALENVREIVLYFLTSCSDRNTASLIDKSWFNAETLLQLELFIGNCYAVSKEKEEWNTPKL